ncbi:hypothetical protein [Streptomyces sp. NPDC016845]|uniref:hypothetical protein n=1 Tax=Streptomyces sp. NPDC016845 TaxID=3364972 RepID=UPI00379FE62F
MSHAHEDVVALVAEVRCLRAADERATAAYAYFATRDEQRADREETERAHEAGDHEYCGLHCESQFPTEMLRNSGYPGTAGMLHELLRRTSEEGRQTPAVTQLPQVWTVSGEDQSMYGLYTDEITVKLAMIEYYETEEERCPDYGWRTTDDGLELLAGGEPTCIYLSREPVRGAPTPADRAATTQQAAEEADRG